VVGLEQGKLKQFNFGQCVGENEQCSDDVNRRISIAGETFTNQRVVVAIILRGILDKKCK
jgi:hypothetical protein